MLDRILWIVPSRNRPKKLERFLESWLNTTSGYADVLIALDEDDFSNDHLIKKYPDIIWEKKPKPEGASFLEVLNITALNYVDKYKFLAFTEDDCVFQTKDYEKRFIEKLNEIGPNAIVYGEDLVDKKNRIFFPVMNSSIVKRLGFMVPRSLRCQYADNFWRDMGIRLNSSYKFKDVIIQHLHFSVDDGVADEISKDIYNTKFADALAYKNYYSKYFERDMKKLLPMHVIVQAGGRGSRLRHHTWNKPKCLVSIKGKPLLYHLFDQFPTAYFHIIGDYAFDQLENYLCINPPLIKYNLIKATEKGTCAGIAEALKSVPAENPLLITWSDLLINNFKEVPYGKKPVVITTHAFTCRWSVTEKRTIIEQVGPRGIPGMFYATRAEYFPAPPESGEFVKWFSKNVIEFNYFDCEDMEEIGDFFSVENKNDTAGFCRFFNEVVIEENKVIKKAIDPNFKHLIEKEQFWYKSVNDLGFRRIPNLISTDPYILEKIKGKHAFQFHDLTDREKRSVLSDYIDSLNNLHSLGVQPALEEDARDIYIKKTVDRVASVSKLIPNFNKEAITINGCKCKNIFLDIKTLDSIFNLINPKYFTPIHGDPTFSNTIIDKNLKVWYIDPRGYFSKPGVWGDPFYDFAKVYYSAIGGYDIFNRRKFKIVVDSETVEVIMEESSFINIGKEIFEDYLKKDLVKIELIHGLIWLSLSGYVKDDIDSIIGSFYLGLYYLEQGLKKI